MRHLLVLCQWIIGKQEHSICVKFVNTKIDTSVPSMAYIIYIILWTS